MEPIVSPHGRVLFGDSNPTAICAWSFAQLRNLNQCTLATWFILIRVISLPFTLPQIPTASCVKIINHEDSWGLICLHLEINQDHTSHVVDAIPNSLLHKMKTHKFSHRRKRWETGLSQVSRFLIRESYPCAGQRPSHMPTWWWYRLMRTPSDLQHSERQHCSVTRTVHGKHDGQELGRNSQLVNSMSAD